MYLKFLNRTIHENVIAKLSQVILNLDLNDPDVGTNSYFKSFVQEAYKVSRNERPSVSQLADMFRMYKCVSPGTLATKYAMQLEIMAQRNNNLEFRV